MIQSNTITYNGFGGIDECDGTIRNNLVAFNKTPTNSGGGSGIVGCDGIIEKNIVAWNSTDTNASGIAGCDGTIKNNLVLFNHAVGGLGGPPGGGAGIAGCDGDIYNNVVYGNSTERIGGGIWLCDGNIRNNIIWGNTAAEGDQYYESSVPSYCCIEDWNGGGTGNISQDPLFIDPSNRDFRLLSTSPCIDAGAFVRSVTSDYWGDPRGLDGTAESRGDGSNYDIGADEFLGKELFHLGSDIDGTGWVDAVDLLRLRDQWKAPVSEPSEIDLNGDDRIDSTDLDILIRDWHRGTEPG
ncbi:MAG: hypothetical protein H6751_13975 [Candidatus Omnitrophica bacterium]|nr:hypothetical protein [Candidatus Omnitrophota bacterium]